MESIFDDHLRAPQSLLHYRVVVHSIGSIKIYQIFKHTNMCACRWFIRREIYQTLHLLYSFCCALLHITLTSPTLRYLFFISIFFCLILQNSFSSQILHYLHTVYEDSRENVLGQSMMYALDSGILSVLKTLYNF